MSIISGGARRSGTVSFEGWGWGRVPWSGVGAVDGVDARDTHREETQGLDILCIEERSARQKKRSTPPRSWLDGGRSVLMYYVVIMFCNSCSLECTLAGVRMTKCVRRA